VKNPTNEIAARAPVTYADRVVRRGRVIVLGGVSALVTAALAAGSGACRSSTDCTCTVERGGERRVLACGENACVGGVTLACGDDEQVLQRGACTEENPPPPPSTSPDSGGTPPPVDTSCDDLRTFCSSSCNRPASTAADCVSVANAGDPQACASWRATSSVVCRP
jgi:hypothetical protein